MIDVDFVALLNDAKKENKLVDKFYRLYYNKDTGKPIAYSMQQESGDYITVTKKQYAEGRYDVIIMNNTITKTDTIEYSRKLTPDANGIACHSSNVLIVDPNSTSKWKVKTTIAL